MRNYNKINMKKTYIAIIVLSVLLVLLGGYVTYTEGSKYVKEQEGYLINRGALQMRQAIFEAVQKGEVQLADAEGKNVITIITKK